MKNTRCLSFEDHFDRYGVHESVETSLDDAERYASDVLYGRGVYKERNKSISIEADKSWDLGEGLKGAIDLLKNGWPEGRGKITQARDKIMSSLKTKNEGMGLFSVRYQATGGAYVDVGRFCMGDPDHFVDFEPARGSRSIKILVNPSVHCGVDAKDAMRTGAAVLAAIEILKASGISVEIAIAQASSYEKSHATLIPLCSGSHYTDPDIMAYTIGHPAFIRRCMLATWEQALYRNMLKSYGISPSGGYGRALSYDDQLSSFKRLGWLSDGDIFIANYNGTQDDVDAEKIVLDCIAKAGLAA